MFLHLINLNEYIARQAKVRTFAVLILLAFASLSCTGKPASPLKVSPAPSEKALQESSSRVELSSPETTGDIADQSASFSVSTQQGARSDAAVSAGGGEINKAESAAVRGIPLPSGWPEDVPIMPGFTITVAVDDGKGLLRVGAVGDVPLEKVVDFYSNLAGWNLMSNAPQPTSLEAKVISYSRVGEMLSIVIDRRNDLTRLNLTYVRSSTR